MIPKIWEMKKIIGKLHNNLEIIIGPYSLKQKECLQKNYVIFGQNQFIQVFIGFVTFYHYFLTLVYFDL